jgi:hypothetical protein
MQLQGSKIKIISAREMEEISIHGCQDEGSTFPL